jgi:hypothetical protein
MAAAPASFPLQGNSFNGHVRSGMLVGWDKSHWVTMWLTGKTEFQPRQGVKVYASWVTEKLTWDWSLGLLTRCSNFQVRAPIAEVFFFFSTKPPLLPYAMTCNRGVQPGSTSVSGFRHCTSDHFQAKTRLLFHSIIISSFLYRCMLFSSNYFQIDQDL